MAGSNLTIIDAEGEAAGPTVKRSENSKSEHAAAVTRRPSSARRNYLVALAQ
jgi:hypothetical protein